MVEENTILGVLKQKKHVYFQTKQAIISLKGPDAFAFLSRLSTNDLGTIAKQGFVQTSFTNNKGRMIDHCIAIASGDQGVLVVSSHTDAKILIEWLSTYHFVEDIEINDLSAQFTFCYVVTTSEQLTDTDFPLWSHTTAEGTRITIFATLHVPAQISKLTESEWETLRVMCLMPAAGREIHDGVMPQNINLEDFISETKGCYIGQEVIAKAQTYQKHVKKLCGINVDAITFAQLAPGLRVVNERGQSGEITSVAPLFVPGEINALVLSDLSEKIGAQEKSLRVPSAFQTKTNINRKEVS